MVTVIVVLANQEMGVHKLHASVLALLLFISLTTQAMDDSIILPEIPTDEENSDDGNVSEIDENFYIIAEEDDELDEDVEFEANCNEDTGDEFEEDEYKTMKLALTTHIEQNFPLSLLQIFVPEPTDYLYFS